MKSTALLLVLSLLFLATPKKAAAIVTRTCPEQIKLEFSDPLIEANYAIAAYEALFAEILSIKEEFNLVDIHNSQCEYEAVDKKSPVYKVVLRGTFRKGSQDPATMVTYMILPIKGVEGEDIGDAIVYSPLSKVTRRGIKLKNKPSFIFYQSAVCLDGPCVSSHIYVGTYAKSSAK